MYTLSHAEVVECVTTSLNVRSIARAQRSREQSDFGCSATEAVEKERMKSSLNFSGDYILKFTKFTRTSASGRGRMRLCGWGYLNS